MATKAAAHYDTAALAAYPPSGPSTAITERDVVSHWPDLRETGNHPDLLDNPGSRLTTEYREESSLPEITPLIRLRRQSATARRFQVLQQWEGVVTSTEGNSFEAHIRDLTKTKNPMEIAEFSLADISPADKSLIRPGCVFYWIIGYETRSGGQVTRTSEIRVRRAPLWTPGKLDALKSRARDLFTLGEDDGEEAARPNR